MSDHTKRCTKCKEEKPATTEFFHRNSKSKDGFKIRCKVCRNEDNTKWARNNQDKVLAARERRKERQKEYMKEWKKNNQEHIREYNEKNKDHIKERRRRYRKKNKTKINADNAMRQALMKNQLPEDADLELIKKIYDHRPEGYEVDHMIPISKGGLHHQDNLCYLPALVNRSKGGRTIEEFGEKEFNENVINWKSIVPL